MLRNGEISEKCFKYLTQFSMRTSRFICYRRYTRALFRHPADPISLVMAALQKGYLPLWISSSKKYLLKVNLTLKTQPTSSKLWKNWEEFQTGPSWQPWTFRVSTPIFPIVKGLDLWQGSGGIQAKRSETHQHLALTPPHLGPPDQ